MLSRCAQARVDAFQTSDSNEAHVPEPSLSSPPATGVTKALSLLVIALMVVAIIYATWIAIRNWSHIGV